MYTRLIIIASLLAADAAFFSISRGKCVKVMTLSDKPSNTYLYLHVQFNTYNGNASFITTRDYCHANAAIVDAYSNLTIVNRSTYNGTVDGFIYGVSCIYICSNESSTLVNITATGIIASGTQVELVYIG